MWWANEGKTRMLAIKAANKRRSRSCRIGRRTVSPMFLGVVCWAVVWLSGILLYFIFVFRSSRTTHHPGMIRRIQCNYEGPFPGFLPGCVMNCATYETIEKAQTACSTYADCGGITLVAGTAARPAHFELRAGEKVVNGNNAVHFEQSYLKRCAKQYPKTDFNLAEPEGLVDTVYHPPPGDESHYHQAGDVDLDSDQAPPAPEFWKPDTENIDQIGSYVNGQPTIFIGIASYRDMMCHDTIERALKWAKRPDNVFFGVVEQIAPGDTRCFQPRVPCEQDPSQLLCKHKEQIRIHTVPAKAALGPTWGRHRADSLYRGEYYAMQIDAHMFFVNEWDQNVINQFLATKNEYAVISTYPTDSTNAIDKYGRSRHKSTPTICRSVFVGNRMLKHESAHEFFPPAFVGESPILQVWWAAGVSFSRGHRIVRVPYDCCLPMLFDGEETSMAWRMWTNGYDFYTFRYSVVFHPYDRKVRPPLFWENGGRHPNDATRAAKRLQKIFHLKPNIKEDSYDDTKIEMYGIGHRSDRPLEKFFEVFGVDIQQLKVRDNCKAATSGNMHAALVPFIRPDRKGIDYSRVPSNVWERDFRTAAMQAGSRIGPYADEQYQASKANNLRGQLPSYV